MTREEFNSLNIGDDVVYTNGYTTCTYIVIGKELLQGNVLYETDGDIFYIQYDKLETKAMYDEQKDTVQEKYYARRDEREDR